MEATPMFHGSKHGTQRAFRSEPQQRQRESQRGEGERERRGESERGEREEERREREFVERGERERREERERERERERRERERREREREKNYTTKLPRTTLGTGREKKMDKLPIRVAHKYGAASWSSHPARFEGVPPSG